LNADFNQKITKLAIFFLKKSQNSEFFWHKITFLGFFHLKRLERSNECPRRRYVWCIHPFGHHLKADEVFLQGFQLAAVAAEDDARSGDHRSPTEEGKVALLESFTTEQLIRS
jgi:hypothetical protein